MLRRVMGFTFAFLLVTSQAFAVDIRTVDPGDVYYLYRIAGSNAAVQVVRVDIPNNRVKIRYATGAVDWIRPDKLMTQRESDNADAATNAAGAAIAIGVIACIMDPDCGKKK